MITLFTSRHWKRWRKSRPAIVCGSSLAAGTEKGTETLPSGSETERPIGGSGGIALCRGKLRGASRSDGMPCSTQAARRLDGAIACALRERGTRNDQTPAGGAPVPVPVQARLCQASPCLCPCDASCQCQCQRASARDMV